MNMKKFFCRLLAVLTAAALLAGCSDASLVTKQSDGRISISMYMWDRSMFKMLTPWLEQKFPEIDFTFVQSYSTIDYYKDLLERGEDIPDIITCRRFSLNDAAPLAEHLMDFEQNRGRRYVLQQLSRGEPRVGRSNPLAANVRRGGQHYGE